VLDTFYLMISAGYETSVNLITNAVQALLAHPENLTRIREGAIGWEDAVEETLRLEGPVMYLPMRFAVEDIDLGEGVVIRKGDPIIIGFAAAGRDPELHPEGPERFDPTRTSKEHLAFGHGPHFCLGAHLARLEAEVALATLFKRLPDLTLAHPGEEPARLPSFIVNGPVELEIVPHPA
jgi:cytochrome P450